MAGILDLLAQLGSNYADSQAGVSPTANATPANPSAAPASNVANGLSANPQIVPISAAEAASAASQQSSAASPAAAPTSAKAVGNGPLPTQNVDPGAVAPVTTSASSPAASDYNADGTQATPGASASGAQPAGGLLGSLAGAANQAVSDPVKSQGFLSSIGNTLSNVGTKLQNMPPGSAQGFLAAGMATLANNNGHNNLAQLIGMGGTEGLNAFQQVNANRMQMGMNAANIQHQQVADQVALQNSQTETFKAKNPFLTVGPGQTVIQPGGSGAPAATIGSGGVKAAGTRDIINADGTKTTVATDESGNVIPGTGTTSQNASAVGPLTPDQLKTVNEASAAATTQQQSLAKTQALINQLGQVNIPAGLKAKGQDLWTQVTGDQTQGQTLRNLVQTQAYQNMLATWKPGIGGRLTNTDVNILKGHMPPDTASSATWQQYLTSFGKLQADSADQAARGAAFTSQNRGDQGTLNAPLTVGGVQYQKGASYQQVVMGQGGTPVQQSGQNGGAPAMPNSALAAEAAKRGFKQNANGQWVAS